MTALAHNDIVTINGTNCPDGKHEYSDAIVTKYCNGTAWKNWKRGLKVRHILINIGWKDMIGKIVWKVLGETFKQKCVKSKCYNVLVVYCIVSGFNCFGLILICWRSLELSFLSLK